MLLRMLGFLLALLAFPSWLSSASTVSLDSLLCGTRTDLYSHPFCFRFFFCTGMHILVLTLHSLKSHFHVLSPFNRFFRQVRCATVMKKRKGDHFMDYADVVETACLTGPATLVPFSSFARSRRDFYWSKSLSLSTLFFFVFIGNWSTFSYASLKYEQLLHKYLASC